VHRQGGETVARFLQRDLLFIAHQPRQKIGGEVTAAEKLGIRTVVGESDADGYKDCWSLRGHKREGFLIKSAKQVSLNKGTGYASRTDEEARWGFEVPTRGIS